MRPPADPSGPVPQDNDSPAAGLPRSRPGSERAGRASAASPPRNAAPGRAGGFVCEICGAAMYERHCRIVCARCGYQRDCTDP